MRTPVKQVGKPVKEGVLRLQIPVAKCYINVHVHVHLHLYVCMNVADERPSPQKLPEREGLLAIVYLKIHCGGMELSRE